MIVKNEDMRQFVGSRNLLVWCVLTAGGHMLGDEAFSAALGDGKDDAHEIRLLLNGHDLPVEEVFADAEQQHDRLIKDAAAKMLRERLGDINEKAREAVEELTRGLRQFAEDHGIEFSEDEEW